jgi:hypothetical protein
MSSGENTARLVIGQSPHKDEWYVILHTGGDKQYLFTGSENEARVYHQGYAEGLETGVKMGGGSSIKMAAQ